MPVCIRTKRDGVPKEPVCIAQHGRGGYPRNTRLHSPKTRTRLQPAHAEDRSLAHGHERPRHDVGAEAEPRLIAAQQVQRARGRYQQLSVLRPIAEVLHKLLRNGVGTRRRAAAVAASFAATGTAAATATATTTTAAAATAAAVTTTTTAAASGRCCCNADSRDRHERSTCSFKIGAKVID